MARTALSVQQISRDGLTPTYTSATTDGHSVVNDGRVFIHVKNNGASPITVTVQTPGAVDGLAIADRQVTVSNGSEKMIGPFLPNVYNQSDGSIWINYSATTSVTVAALRL